MFDQLNINNQLDTPLPKPRINSCGVLHTLGQCRLFIRTKPKPEVRKLGKGGDENGPRILPALHSLQKEASCSSGFCDVEARLFTEWANCGPEYPMMQPCSKSSISYSTKALSWWLLNSHSHINGHMRVQGSGLLDRHSHPEEGHTFPVHCIRVGICMEFVSIVTG